MLHSIEVSAFSLSPSWLQPALGFCKGSMRGVLVWGALWQDEPQDHPKSLRGSHGSSSCTKQAAVSFRQHLAQVSRVSTPFVFSPQCPPPLQVQNWQVRMVIIQIFLGECWQEKHRSSLWAVCERQSLCSGASRAFGIRAGNLNPIWWVLSFYFFQNKPNNSI